MGGFDEILELEDRLAHLNSELTSINADLAKSKNEQKQLIFQAKEAEDRIAALEENFQFLKKEAEVVNLSDFEETREMLTGTRSVLIALKQDIIKLDRTAFEQTKRIHLLEKQVESAQVTLSTYQKVIEFRRS